MLQVLDKEGIGLLWGRVLELCSRYLPKDLGQMHAGELCAADEAGTLGPSPWLKARSSARTLAAGTLAAADFSADGEHFLARLPGEEGDIPSLSEVFLTLGTWHACLKRRKGKLSFERSYVFFGARELTGGAVPELDGEDGDGLAVCYARRDGAWLLLSPQALPGRAAVEVRRDVLVSPGMPSNGDEAVNLAYFQEKTLMQAGEGEKSVCQSGAGASGVGAFSANAGQAMGERSFAAGLGTAEGGYSTALGRGTRAGAYALAAGYDSAAPGSMSLAAGGNCTASGTASAALGRGTLASGPAQLAFGRYNLEDSQGRYAELVGCGNEGARRNARTLDWEGNETLLGAIRAGALVLTDPDGRRWRFSCDASGQLKGELDEGA